VAKPPDERGIGAGGPENIGANIPNYPFENLPPALQDIFWSTPGADYLEPGYQTNEAQAFFAIGFGYTGEQYERMGLEETTVGNARRDYMDLMGMLWRDFDWDAWRDAMGYNEQ
jgi:hypothetical protein